MAEMTHAGEYHGDAMFVGCRDDFRIAARAARLDDGFDSEFGQGIETVAKWEECIGGNRCAIQG